MSLHIAAAQAQSHLRPTAQVAPPGPGPTGDDPQHVPLTVIPDRGGVLPACLAASERDQ
jgi:hypothetical protein